MRSLCSYVCVFACLTLVATPAAQESLADGARRKTFDQLLDLYVRNGDVYYRALKAERARLDGFISLQATTAVDKLSREEQIAFWLNAYNAIALKTVIDHYPLQGKSSAYPAKSIRQISGAFERLPHRVAGRTLTLDQIEQTVLAGFRDPRVFFALGRGAVGSGRLRSEAFVPSRIEEQLAETAAECVTRAQCIHVDRETAKVHVSSIFLVREGVRRGVHRQGPGDVRGPQPHRARGHRLRPAEPAAEREGIPGKKQLSAGLHPVRLGPERPHGAGRQVRQVGRVGWVASVG